MTKKKLTTRDNAFANALSWGTANARHADSHYTQGKVATRYSTTTSEILATMTEKQLRLVAAMCAGSYTRGYRESREFWAPKLHEVRKQLKEQAERSELPVYLQVGSK